MRASRAILRCHNTMISPLQVLTQPPQRPAYRGLPSDLIGLVAVWSAWLPQRRDIDSQSVLLSAAQLAARGGPGRGGLLVRQPIRVIHKEGSGRACNLCVQTLAACTTGFLRLRLALRSSQLRSASARSRPRPALSATSDRCF